MPSSLTFDATKIFRDKLLSRNLKPYKVDGSFTPPAGPQSYETQQRDIEVIDSPDDLIKNNPFVDTLYTNNPFGPEGGYDKNINYNNVIITNTPNQGPYDAMDAKLDNGSQDSFARTSTLINQYMNPFINEGGPSNARYSTPANPYLPTSEYNTQRNQDYPNFDLSNTYTPYNILFGETGNLSQDSALQQIGAKALRQNFDERIANEIEQRTTDRLNILPALNDPVKAVQVAFGKTPAIEGDYKITRPANPVVAAADLALRLGGAYFPASPIPGAYFLDDQQNPGLYTQVATAFNSGLKTLGGVFGLNLKSLDPNPSQIFLNNTGSWTRRRMFYNLNFNRYRPIYSRGLVDDVAQSLVGGVLDFLGLDTPGALYVGTDKIDPSRITSPSGEIPVNGLGEPDITIVYGPEKLAKDFDRQEYNFGLAGKSSTDGDGSIDGGFVWTSPKYKENAGFKVKKGGEIAEQDSEFPIISSKYNENSSSEKEFRDGSILDKTQRIINSQPSGSKRLSHVGNAMDQVSKVFNDGYKEITKGSKVKSFVNEEGQPIIKSKVVVNENEYCRIFTKDTPYYTYNDLQKKDRLYRSIEGLSTYSILDNVYNINIAPTESNYSKSGFKERGTENTRFVKKYMFSLENLAWRTSNRPGYRVSDLPECERGPNGGRIMWFPPYNLTFSENVSPSWNPTTFLGRPEPVYTYKDTTRTGQLSWSIVVDHPSILNLIVNKYLEKENPQKVNDIVDSFFAGCLKYDLYELAKVYNTIPPDQLLYYQEILGSPIVTEETVTEIVREEIGQNNVVTQETNTVTVNFDEFKNLSFYFDNDIPKRNESVGNFSNYFNSYRGKQSDYKGSAGTFFEQVIINNFDVIDKDGGVRKKIVDVLSKDPKGTIRVNLIGSASSPQTVEYNQSLSQRRIESVKNYFNSYTVPGSSQGAVSGITDFINSGRLKISDTALGEGAVIPVSAATNSSKKDFIGNQIDCRENINDPNQKIISVQAAACRAVRIDSIDYIEGPKEATTTTTTMAAPNEKEVPRRIRKTVIPRIKEADYRGLTKRVIRHLLSECDYFKMVEAETPMIYNSMKEKIKYFSPTFHSTTPEGLNSRLTFLQQCTRPGDTIPTISTDGTLVNNDAYNTAFGAPPVLVLRIGDFYHTKVLCNSLSISYEPLVYDLNPEGIGVQPMIAKISMGITFIGGSGLKEPIEQLQNALSFNYYANTEIYDDRAESTEDTLEFDKKFYKDLQGNLPQETPVEEKKPEPPKDAGDAIGTLTQKTSSGGTINYKEIMNKLLTQTNTYFTTTFGKLEEVSKNYNYGILQIYNQKRDYKDGDFFEFNAQKTKTTIYGKSPEYQKTITRAKNTLIDKIKDSDLPIQKELENNKNINQNFKKSFKGKLYEYVNLTLYPEFKNKLVEIEGEMSKTQIELIQYVSKINYVMTDRDGKINKQGDPTIYKISGETSVVSKFKDDYTAIATGLTKYITSLETDKIITSDTDFVDSDNFKLLTDVNQSIKIEGSTDSVSFSNQYEKLFFLFFSQVIINQDKLNSLIDYLTALPENTNINNAPEEVKKSYAEFKITVTNSLKARADLYKKEQDAIIKLFEDKKPTYNQPAKPYESGTDRIFDYEIMNPASDDDKKRLNTILNTSGNANSDKQTFNGKKKFT